MLKVDHLAASYGDSRVLFDVSFEIGDREFVTLLGRNGMGKTTTVKTIFGLLPAAGGRIIIGGQDMTSAPPHLIARAGLALVPEGRQIFPTLSVEENLIATSRPGPGRRAASTKEPERDAVPAWDLKRIYRLFPQLEERRRHQGDQLSGGEQQMLAIGRALMTNPSLLVLDEATEGLAPLVRQTIWACLGEIKQAGVAIMIIDKNIQALAAFADRHVILEKGRTVWSGNSEALLATDDLKNRYLHL